MTDSRTSGPSEGADPPLRSAIPRSSLSRSSASSWGSTKTRSSSRTSGATTPISSQNSCTCIAPPLPGRQRTCGRPRNSSGESSSPAFLTTLPSPYATRCPCQLASVRPSPPLQALQRGGCFRQGHPPQADLLRLSGARKGLLAWGDHPHLGSSGQCPRAFRAPRTCPGNFWPDHRRPQLPFAKDRGGVGGHWCEASGPVFLQEERPYPEKERLPRSASLPDRHHFQPAHRALFRKEGVGEGPVASGKQTAAQSPLSYRGLPAQPSDGQSTPTALKATHLKTRTSG